MKTHSVIAAAIGIVIALSVVGSTVAPSSTAAGRVTSNITASESSYAALSEGAFCDDFDGAGINSFWSVFSAPPDNTAALSAAQYHSPGQSILLSTPSDGLPRVVGLSHRFSSGTQGTASVYFYDTLLNPPSAGAVLSLSKAGPPAFTAGVGVRSSPTPLDSNVYYTFGSAPGPTSVQRSLGWHHFVINAGDSGYTIYVDEILVQSVTGAFKFDAVSLSANSPFLNAAGATFFFDDFCLTPPSECRVNHDVRLFYQSDPPPEVPQPYFGGVHDAGCLTANFGCALVTVANTLRSFDNPSLSDTPGVLDANLLANGGYQTGTCRLRFDRVPQAASNFVELVGGGLILEPLLDDYLEQHFCRNGERVILRLREYVNGNLSSPRNHFVLVTGKKGDGDWEVFDPGWRNASPPEALRSLSGHYVGFTTFTQGNPQIAVSRRFALDEVITFAKTSIAEPDALSVTALSPVELLVVDPQGRRLGYQDGSHIFDIPQGSYLRDFPIADAEGTGQSGGDASGVKTAYIPSPQEGAYRIEVTGTGSGTYRLEFRAVASDGTAQVGTALGLAGLGSRSTYQLGYSSAPGSAMSVVRSATFQSTIDDVRSGRQLGFIDNQGVADSLISKIEAAGRGQVQASKNILRAFKNEVHAQAGRHITSLAAEVLREDADSLLGQSP